MPAVGQAVLEFLRGNPTNEGVSTGQFRVRATASFGENFLGDIVNSQPVYVGPPNAPYTRTITAIRATRISSAAHAGRPARVYAGANDGMLHAFDDATGNEAWAYIPHDLYRPDKTGLGALAYQDGALPPFRHHFYVDSTPRIYDVNFGGGSADWHSLLVGGLGKGGKSYYALDVTNPGSITDEAQAPTQYLWTFTDPDMGYSYGRPMLAKTRAFGGAWLMVVAAGYNNPSGEGKIFFVDAKTGTKLKEMTHRLRQFGDEPVGPRAHLRLYGGLPQPADRPDLRRRSVRQLLALRRHRSESEQLDGGEDGALHRSGRQSAAGDHSAADRGRHHQRRRSLGVHRHRKAAGRYGP